MLSELFSRARVSFTHLLALCLLAAPQARALQQRQPGAPAQDEEEVVRISTELVQTDVMVFDKDGKFVEGLKPEQFELRVDGRPQSVTFFERVEAGAVNEDAQIAAARGLKSGADRGASLPLDRGRTVIFFVDDLHLSPASHVRARKTLLRFIDEEIGQNDEAAVISASGRVGFLQQFTGSKTVLRAAASRLSARPHVTRDMQNPPMTETQALAVERNDTMVRDFFIENLLRETPGMRRDMAESLVEMRARSILTQSNNAAANTLSSLHSVIRGSSAIPGRKVLFFISDGFVVDDRGGPLRDWMRRTADAAARAGVVIYSLDAQGLRTGQQDASTEAAFDPTGRLAATNLSETSTMQSPLYTLASETGGRALVNTNALERAVTGALKETAVYYLLAWKPDAAAGGRGGPKYQRVEVGVRGRPDLRVIVRRGFYNSPPPEDEAAGEGTKKKKKGEAAADGKSAPEAERQLSEALRSALPRSAFPTMLSLNYVNAEGGTLLTASVELDRSTLAAGQGGALRGDFDLLGIVLNDNGKPVNSFGKTLKVAFDADAAPQQRIIYSHPFRLSPGLYQVRVAARHAGSGRVGSAMQWVEIPEFKPGQLSLSSILIGERASAAQASAPQAGADAAGVMLSVDRRFARSSWIRFVTFIYNASAAGAARPDVALQIQIFRDDQPVLTAPVIKVSTDGVPDITRIPYAAELALASFPAGRYVLQVTAIDRAAKSSVSQRTSFVVE